MPHPRAVESSANKAAAIGRAVDARILDHVAAGRPLPSESSIMRHVAPLVRASIIAAFDDIGIDYTAADVTASVARVMADVRVRVRRSLRDAALRRRAVAKIDEAALQRAEDGTATGRRRTVAVFVLLVVLFAVKRGRPPREDEVRRIAATAGEPMPRRVGPGLRSDLRTGVADERNGAAADVAKRHNLALFVEDGLKGPTDDECERVHGKYASPEWAARHTTEHPNCTRRMRPVILPDGAHVTLLA